jgi:lipid-A-disaccharide synthase
MIVAGEASGDLLGANLIRAVRRVAPDTGFFGVGSHGMAEAGCDVLISATELAVMGIIEVAGNLPTIWRSFHALKRILSGHGKPDALVLIDFPDFNLRLAKHAKRSGVPVLYYVSPQVWAWRRGRVKKIAKVVDSLAAIFPFEPEYYAGQDIMVTYVGHPLLDEYAATSVQTDLLKRLQVPTQKKVVGLFPGSRRSELQLMLQTLIKAAGLIHDHQPDVHFLVPLADTLSGKDVQAKFPRHLPVSFIERGQTSS